MSTVDCMNAVKKCSYNIIKTINIGSPISFVVIRDTKNNDHHHKIDKTYYLLYF